jgi:hypothetical protein
MPEEEMNNRKWVIMVYLAADDTLANFAIESLKQLKDTATDEVVVAAQFDPDGPSAEHQVRRYVFDKTARDGPLLDDSKFWGPDEHRSLNMAEPATLSRFMNWVYRDYKAENYCLILWGHGPELLFELPGAYFTPLQLKNALQATDQTEKQKLQIIAVDACSTSMCEIAYELKDQAKFLVASQEEVPDPSFPYHTLVRLFSGGSEVKVKSLCQKGVVDYVKAYQEYFYSESTGMHPVTLAAIELEQMQYLKEPLKKLANALISAATDDEAVKAIHSARAESQGYVGGLYVDLHDFCDKLAEKAPKLKNACDKVSKAIDAAVVARAGVVGGHVVEVVDQRSLIDGHAEEPSDSKLLSHGLSIYFPYLSDGEKIYIEQDLVKGIPRMVDKSNDMVAGFQAMNALSARVRYDIRRQMIRDIESYYQDPPFDFTSDTHWYQFIQQGWSRILAQEEPGNIDTRYLALQCITNLLHVIRNCSGVNGEAGLNKGPAPLSNVGALLKSRPNLASSGH